MEAAEIYLRRSVGRVQSYKLCVWGRRAVVLLHLRLLVANFWLVGFRVRSRNSGSEKCICQPVIGARFSLRTFVSFGPVIILAMPRIHHLLSSPSLHYNPMRNAQSSLQCYSAISSSICNLIKWWLLAERRGFDSWTQCTPVHLILLIFAVMRYFVGAIGWGTALQVGRSSWVWFPIWSLELTCISLRSRLFSYDLGHRTSPHISWRHTGVVVGG
jgi:hypothetical protein